MLSRLSVTSSEAGGGSMQHGSLHRRSCVKKAKGCSWCSPDDEGGDGSEEEEEEEEEAGELNADDADSSSPSSVAGFSLLRGVQPVSTMLGQINK